MNLIIKYFIVILLFNIPFEIKAQYKNPSLEINFNEEIKIEIIIAKEKIAENKLSLKETKVLKKYAYKNKKKYWKIMMKK